MAQVRVWAGAASVVWAAITPVFSVHAAPNDAPAWVQEEFGKFMAGCLPGVDRIRFRSNPREAALIPKNVIELLKINENISYQNFSDTNMTRIFGYVYSDSEKSNLSNFVPESQRYLQINYDRDNDQLTEPGLGSIVYNEDCAGALDFAAKGRGGADFAPVTFQAAGRSAQQRRFSGRLSITSGRFENPIVKQWQGNNAAQANKSELMQVYVAITFWEWYSRNGISPGKYWILNSIDGLSLYRFSEDSRGADNSGSIKADLAIPFLSSNFKGSGQLRSESLTKLEQFRFARYDLKTGTGTYSQFSEFPSIAAVQFAIREAGGRLVRVALADKEDDVARPKSVKNLLVDIEGIPWRFCSRLMTARGTSAASLVLDTPSRVKPDGASSVCRFPVRYTVPATGGQSLDFTIGPVGINLPTGVAPFEIPVKHTFRESDTPGIVNLPDAAVVAISQSFPGDITQLTWHVAGVLKHGGNADFASAIDVSGLTPQSCSADAERVTDFAVRHALGAPIDTNQRAITVIVTARYSKLEQNWQSRGGVCRLGGAVKFGTGSDEVRRLLPSLEIMVPDDVDTLPAA
jgi:hypothetical protein